MSKANQNSRGSRYIIGIDLGTTNCALSYIDTLDERPMPRMLEIPQWESEDAVIAAETLPSFFYLATKGECKRNQLLLPFERDEAGDQDPPLKEYAVGRYARQQASVTPGRVIHSAKSWLCHGGVNREARILPWHSDEIIGSARRSPIEVSSAYLDHLRRVWNHVIAAHEVDYRLENQDVVITVPASFDEVSQRLTLAAAQAAGYNLARVRLLEEPQSAFYSWLSAKRAATPSEDGSQALLAILPDLKERPQLVLICDVGGGTSDFSLFKIERVEDPNAPPAIERIAVSDHLLLGGDNIDLGIAHELEQRLTGGQKKLSSRQWAQLVFESRRLKERGLAVEEAPEDELFVSIAGEGGSLFAATMTASIGSQEILAMIEAGYLPDCPANARPSTNRAGLKEFGLPFAQDSAITRHIAAFLGDREVDAVLFTGGTLKPPALQRRLAAAISSWQTHAPVILANPEMDLAVALGASYYGAVLRTPRHKIGGGYARSLYAEVAHQNQASGNVQHALVCLIPQGVEAGELVKIDQLNLKLTTNQPVRFQLFSSNRRPDDRAGDLIDFVADAFHPLPALHTKLETSRKGQASLEKINVTLEAQVQETGVLELYCVSEGEQEERWQLSFNTRETAGSQEAMAGAVSEGGQALELPGARVSDAQAQAAKDMIRRFYGKKKKGADDIGSPKSLAKDLEDLFGLSRDEWDIAFLRTFWPTLQLGLTRRGRSVAHEVAWLYLSGFCLRPGYGFELDEWRVAELWRAYELGMAHPSERQVEDQWWIMWRRVAGGLSKEQQETIFDKLFPSVRKGNVPSPEAFRLLSSLERVDMDKKIKLGNGLVAQITSGKKQFIQDKIWALARLASRVPLYAGPETIIRPKFVEDWLNQVKHLDCRNKFYKNLTLLYAQAGRLVNDREFDLSEDMRLDLVKRLQACSADERMISPLNQVETVDQEARNRLFGETLPSGLYIETPR